MYNLNYVCLYKLQKQEENGDEPDRQQEYQTDILNIFEMETFDEEAIIDILDTVYLKLKDNEHIKKCMQTIYTNTFMGAFPDMFEYSFIIMYSYEYLYVTHPCVCDLLVRGEISEANLEELLKIIK